SSGSPAPRSKGRGGGKARATRRPGTSRVAWRAKASTRAVFPRPGSLVTRTSWRWPRTACCKYPRRTPRARSRPTRRARAAAPETLVHRVEAEGRKLLHVRLLHGARPARVVSPLQACAAGLLALVSASPHSLNGTATLCPCHQDGTTTPAPGLALA